MHRQGIRIDFEDMDSEDVYDVFLVFLSEYLYNKCAEIRIEFLNFLEDKPMMNYCMECGTKLEI